MESLNGFYPAKILSYNKISKMAQVSVEPFTNGSETGLEAKLAYAVGLDDLDTELSINGSPDCWVFFENGQFKKPVVCFFRTHQTGSITDIFRLRQKRIELIADELFIDAKVHITKDTKSDAGIVSQGDIVAQNVSVATHDHQNVQSGKDKTAPPTAGTGGSGSADGSGSAGGAGPQGPPGPKGEPGADGAPGPQGKPGADGASLPGTPGPPGVDGVPGIPGVGGKPGKNGLSAFQSAVLEGWTGTHAEWLDSLKPKVELYTKDGLQASGQMKMWRGLITSSENWICDYSKAGFTNKPMIVAHWVPGTDDVQGYVSVNTLTATTSQCSGKATAGGQIDLYLMGF